jgi:putative colanic acid biosynthesis acetyltransferase WcaF
MTGSSIRNTFVPDYQDLSRFRLPPNFRGKPAAVVFLWQLVQASLFACSPQFAHGWRRFLLRAFGAKVGRRVVLRPSARVTYPWKVEIGDFTWIGDHAELYSLGSIRIGAHSVVSQRCYLCAGSHDYRSPDFAIQAPPVTVGAHVWLATDVFVGPGVRIGDYAVVGARSSVFSDIVPGAVAFGSPAKVQGRR